MNILLSQDEFHKIVWDIAFKSASYFPEFGLKIPNIGSYMGKRLVLTENGSFILFEACEWCGSKELDAKENCSKCGHPPTASQKGLHK